MEEPLSPNAYRNRNLRLRRKINREKKIFEDRLAAVVLQFSTKIDLDIFQVTEIAKGRIRAPFQIRPMCAGLYDINNCVAIATDTQKLNCVICEIVFFRNRNSQFSQSILQPWL